MANNYTETSFMLPCTKAQATMACYWLGLLESTDPAIMEEIRPIIEDDTDKVYEYMWQNAVKFLRDVSNEGREEWSDGYWLAGFNCTVESDGIWITDNGESFNSDGADLFISTVLDFFNSDEVVCYSAADTCSRKRLDEFGGFAVAVSRNGVEDFISTWQWMQQQKDNFKNGNHKL